MSEVSETLSSPPALNVAHIEDDGLYDLSFVCAYFGGNRPLHTATIYRGIAAGRYPQPVRPSPNVNRWVGRELKAAKAAIIATPREPLISPKHRARGAT